MNKNLITTAADVYRSLCDEGLMLRGDGTGRDDALWNELISRLDLPNDTATIPQALEENQTSIETFIRAFFGCFEPFAVMMAEICSIMEQWGAKKTYHSMSIQYNFSDEDEKIDFTLSHFRDFWHSYQTIYECNKMQIWSEWDMFGLYNDLRGHLSECNALQDDNDNHGNSTTYNWFPGDDIPENWRVDDELLAIANLLTRIHLLLERADSQENRIQDDTSIFLRQLDRVEQSNKLVDFMKQEEIGVHATNRGLLADFKGGLYEAYTNVEKIAEFRLNSRTPSFDEYKKRNGLYAIYQRYKKLPTIEQVTKRMVEDIHSILNLPAWRHRWQLYQVWVGLVVLNELKNCGLPVDLYIPDEKLELYENHPSHLADIAGCKTPISYWAELQTMIPELIGKSKSIRPDYRLSRAPVSNPQNTLLLVEAKQQAQMDQKKFDSLKLRYRSGCPKGLLVFVNYDEFPDNTDDMNIRIISNLRPGQNSARMELIDCIRKIAVQLNSEYHEIEEERRIKSKADEQEAIQSILSLAKEKTKGVGLVSGFHSTHDKETVGAIILDYRTRSHTVFNRGRLVRNDDVVRFSVIQYLRANPLAQLWLAGLDTSPKPAYQFDYDNDGIDANYVECDLDKLINELLSIDKEKIAVIGYSADIEQFSYKERVIIHGFVG